MNRIRPLHIQLIAAMAVILSFIKPLNTLAQSRGTVAGKVVTAGNEPASFVSIGLEGTTNGTTTKENGEFTFKAPAGTYTLIISYVGVQTVQVPVIIVAGQTTTVPPITVNAKQSQLIEVNVIANRGNRFTRKVSVDVGKIPLSNLENAQSYSTVTSELIREQNVFSVDDALRNAPGIQKMWDATGRAGDGGGYFNLRGFTVQSRVRNGVAGIVTSGIDAANIDKVEVIKGPSATLFGSTLTTFGGLINRVTKKPYESFGAEIGQTIGSYNQNRTSIDLNTPITADKSVLFRINSAYAHEGAWQNYGYNRSFAIAPSLSIKASEKLSFLFDMEYYNGKSSAKPFFFFYSTPDQMGVHNANDLKLDYKNAYSNDDIRTSSRSTNYFAQAAYKISDKFTSQTIFTSSNSFSNGASPYYYLVNDAVAGSFGAPDIAGDNNYILRYDQSTANSKLNMTEVQENINGDFNIGKMRNRFVFGLDYQHVNSHQVYGGNFYGYAPFKDASFNYGAFNQAAVDAANAANPLTAANAFVYFYKTNTYSTYFSDVINLTDKLIASAGVRYDRYENKGAQNYAGVQTAEPFNQTAFSPKFGLIYQAVKDEFSFFGNYQNGFVNPGYFTDGNNQTVIAKLQNANQWEGGVKMALFNGKLNGTLSYYNIKVTNVIRAIPNSPVFGSVQDGTQRSKGFEADVIANPVSNVNIVAGFAYNDSKYAAGDPDVIGRRPVTAASPYQANFYVSYHLPRNVIKGLGAGFGGNYASANKIINSASQGVFELPAYTILNANLFYDYTHYHIGLSATNLTDKRYYTGYTTVNPQRLRQVILSVSYKF